MLTFVGSTVEAIIWAMFLLMISLYSGSYAVIQILVLCLCACERMSTLVCMCTCVAGSREKSQVLYLRYSQTTVALFVCLELLLLFLVVFFVCFVLFEAGFLTGLEFVG